MSDDWTPWAGGECPVDPETMIDIKWNNGALSRAATAGFYAEGEVNFWKSRDRTGHIIAYRPARAVEESPPAFGKCGLPMLDEGAIEALAGCLERLWAGGRGGIWTVPIERKRLRHALAAFLIRARDSHSHTEGDEAQDA